MQRNGSGNHSTLRIAAVGDLHCSRGCQGVLGALFAEASAAADVLLLCGDLTDYGHPEEADLLAKEITRSLKIPVVAVLGNHDVEDGKQSEIERILTDAGVALLDGGTFEMDGVGFVGVKGFGGGFGRRMLEPWGEPTIKGFVHEAINESLKLESALAKLRTSKRVVLLHYSPIPETVVGESAEIFAFLGSSRLEDPINRYPVSAVFHGHAHGGSPEGKTREGIPVYNVAAPLLRKHFPDRPPFRLFELALEPKPQAEAVSRAEPVHLDDGGPSRPPSRGEAPLG